MAQSKTVGSKLCGFGCNNKAVTGVVLYALLNPPLWLSKKYEREEVRGLCTMLLR